MNRVLNSLTAVGIVASLAACVDPTPTKTSKEDGGMMSSESMPMKEGMKDGMMATATDAEAAAARTGTGSGVVTAIDRAAGTLTIQHGAIAALQWPAMTMPFKADPPSLLDTVKAGDRIEFDVTTEGNRVTAIRRR